MEEQAPCLTQDDKDRKWDTDVELGPIQNRTPGNSGGCVVRMLPVFVRAAKTRVTHSTHSYHA